MVKKTKDIMEPKDPDPVVDSRITEITTAYAALGDNQYDIQEMFGAPPVVEKKEPGTVQDHLAQNPHFLPSEEPVYFRFNEDMYVAEVAKYIENTYRQHYVGKSGIQSFDAIMAAGHGLGFCVADIIKYAMRFGKKDGYNRKDVLKIIHYGILLLHVMDSEQD